VAQLEERKTKLEQYWAEYNDMQLRLESLDESEAIKKASRKRSMRYPVESASSFPLRRHCDRPSFLRSPQVFANQIVVRSVA